MTSYKSPSDPISILRQCLYVAVGDDAAHWHDDTGRDVAPIIVAGLAGDMEVAQRELEAYRAAGGRTFPPGTELPSSTSTASGSRAEFSAESISLLLHRVVAKARSAGYEEGLRATAVGQPDIHDSKGRESDEEGT